MECGVRGCVECGVGQKVDGSGARGCVECGVGQGVVWSVVE